MRSADEIVLQLNAASPAARRVIRRIVTGSVPVPRTTLSAETNLSLAAITKAVGPLVDVGFLVESQDYLDLRSRGRPVTPVAVAPGAILVVGLKLTRTMIYGVVMDLAGHPVTSESRPAVGNDVAHVVSVCSAIVEALASRVADRTRIVAVGVSVSGEVDVRDGFVRESALQGWVGVALRDLLESSLNLPVMIDNDVRSLVFHEHWFGEARDVRGLALVTIGAGVGSGMMVGGNVVTGAFGVAGELGHLPLASPDRICHCGRRGCVEAVAGFDGIVATWATRTGGSDDFLGVAARAHSGDEDAREAFMLAGRAIGSAIASIVNLIGPDVVYITGEGVAELDLYRAGIDEAFAAHAFGGAAETPISVQPHGFEYWAIAAATTAIRTIVEGPDARAAGQATAPPT
jgi:predicted NBD/HSP70 family sugar kinase